MEKKMLNILTYDHGGFVLWGNEVKPRLRKIYEWMEKYPKLKIGLDYESFTFDEFSKKDPEIVEMIGDLLKKYPDRIGLGATTYGQPLSMFVSEESNVRQLTYAVRTNLDYFGVTPPVYAISEFALNNQTPQLISKCGYKAAILRSHVMGYGYTKTFDSAWGRWIGKDLSEIPAVPVYDGMGRGYNCTTIDNWILSRWSEGNAGYDLEDFEKIFEKYEPLLASRYDDLTQPIEELTAYTETKDNCRYVLLEELPELYGEAVDELKTEDNDFHVQMPWGYCGNEIFNGIRQGEVDVLNGEKLNAFSVMLGGDSMQKTSEEAWKYILAAQHHDVTICGLLDLSRRFIPESLKNSAEVKAKSLDIIKGRFANENGDSLLVINPQSFEVDEWLQISADKDVSVFDGEKALECDMSEYDGKKYLNVHVVIPPLTAKRFDIKNGKNETANNFSFENGILTTPVYRVKLTDSGVAYIDEIKNNRRIFDNGNGALFSAWVNDKECFSNGKWNVTVSGNTAKAVQTGEIGGIPFTFEMNFAGSRARIDCKTRVEMNNELVGRTDITQGRPVPLTLNGHHQEDKLCFVMNLCLDNDRRMVRDLPFAISDWNGALRKTEEYWYPDDRILVDTEVSPEESFNSTTYMQGTYWLAMRDKNHGMAVFNRGCMGSAVQGNKLLIPLIYSNEYMCGTRILEGVFENEFALLPFDDISDAEIHRLSMSYNYMPTAELIGKGNGDMNEFAAAKFSSDGGEVVLTALYPENGSMFARFCNFSDENATAVFAIDGEMSETDLIGNETEKIADGKLSFKPWEIKTVKII